MTKFFSMIALCVVILLGAAYVDINTYLYSGEPPIPPPAQDWNYRFHSLSSVHFSTDDGSVWVVKNTFECKPIPGITDTECNPLWRNNLIFKDNTILEGNTSINMSTDWSGLKNRGEIIFQACDHDAQGNMIENEKCRYVERVTPRCENPPCVLKSWRQK